MRTQDEQEPLVSVIMGLRYQQKNLFLLERSIASILNQEYRNLEFLICENDSYKGVYSRLEQFLKEDARVRLVDGKGTRTLAERLNRCLKMAQGDWVARMDDDDISEPERISVQINYLREFPQVAFVGCVAHLEREGKLVGLRKLPKSPTVRDFYFVQPFLHPTLLFRKGILECVGGYNEERRCIGCEDYDLLLRLYEMGFQGENIQKPLFTYRLPSLNSKKRTMRLRKNEVWTRYVRFRALGLLPGALPYVIKPILVGLIPEKLLEIWKGKHYKVYDR